MQKKVVEECLDIYLIDSTLNEVSLRQLLKHGTRKLHGSLTCQGRTEEDLPIEIIPKICLYIYVEK